jgi:hypothetical protein
VEETITAYFSTAYCKTGLIDGNPSGPPPPASIRRTVIREGQEPLAICNILCCMMRGVLSVFCIRANSPFVNVLAIGTEPYWVGSKKNGVNTHVASDRAIDHRNLAMALHRTRTRTHTDRTGNNRLCRSLPSWRYPYTLPLTN